MQYESPTQPPRQRLTRSAREKMIAGVAGGLAEYFDLDPVVVRLLWIAAGVLTSGLAIPVYGVMWWIMPRQDEVRAPLGWRSTATSAVGRQGVAPEPAASAGAAAEHASAGVATDGEPAAATASGEGPSAGAYADEPSVTTAYTSAPPPSYSPWSVPDHRRRRQKTAGVILIGLGLIFMAHQSGLFSWYAWRYFWPIVLLAVGAALLIRQNAWRR